MSLSLFFYYHNNHGRDYYGNFNLISIVLAFL